MQRGVGAPSSKRGTNCVTVAGPRGDLCQARGKCCTPVLPTEPVEEGDPILEEKPRTLACQNGPREEIVTTGPMSRGDFEAMQREMQRANTGEATFTFVVDTGGHFAAGSVTVLSSTNPSITQRAVRLYQNCQYAPGRIQGVPVATRVRRGFGSEVRINGQ